MTTVNWGLLGKSAVDPEKIEEAVVRLIQVHDDDETSHLETGQALQSHKASEIIDHLARSVVRDKLAHDRYFLDEHFATIDGWTKTGIVTLESIGEVSLKTTDILNNSSDMAIVPQWYYADTSRLDNLPFWQSLIYIPNTTNIKIAFGLGRYTSGYMTGFIFEDNVLKTVWVDQGDVEHTFTISNPNYSVPHRYGVEILAGNVVNFYIDGELVRTETMTSPANFTQYSSYYIKTKTTAWKWFFVFNMVYDQNK